MQYIIHFDFKRLIKLQSRVALVFEPNTPIFLSHSLISQCIIVMPVLLVFQAGLVKKIAFKTKFVHRCVVEYYMNCPLVLVIVFKTYFLK